MIVGAPPACGSAAARAAIVQTHLKMKLVGDSATAVDPGSGDQVVCSGDTMGVTKRRADREAPRTTLPVLQPHPRPW